MGLLTMKKTYIIPAMIVVPFVATQVIAASITGIGGNSGLEIGDGEIPGTADIKEFDFKTNLWDDEW